MFHPVTAALLRGFDVLRVSLCKKIDERFSVNNEKVNAVKTDAGQNRTCLAGC